VHDKIRCADRIVIVLKDTEGVRWELARVIGEGAASKTLFLFDPVAKDPGVWQTLAKMIRLYRRLRRGIDCAWLRVPSSSNWIFFP
jgi:hypothetical protein